MNKKKILVLAVSVCLVAILAIGGTLSYFTDEEEATNTFTVGNVDITLTEPKWVEEKATLIHGREIAKDPTITVEETSQRAYTFMKVQLSDDFAKLIADYATAQEISLTNETEMKALIGEWFSSTVQPKIMKYSLTENYVILGVLSPKDPGQSVTYFDAITIPAEVVGSMIKADGTYEIYITAYAIQAEGFEGQNADAFADRQAAFDALFA